MLRDLNLKYVTITGADDNTEIMDLFDLSARFPFVEWGILFSQSKSGVPRYPSLEWVEELCELAPHFYKKGSSLNFSSHLCGKWVSDIFDHGKVTFLDDKKLLKLFGRVQVNCYKEKLKKAIESNEFWKAALRCNKPILLGGNYGKLELDVRKCTQFGVYPLFDASGGHGKKSNSYRKPFELIKEHPDKRTHTVNSLFCGYAGGLGPENIDTELELILDSVGTTQFWIDMETNVRSKVGNKDYLDLDKVERVLNIVYERLGNG